MSSSHSCPSTPAFSTTTSPPVAAAAATLVWRQNRWPPYRPDGTSRESCLHAFTVKMVPVRAFSGSAPSGLIGRPSRKVPVHSDGIGSSLTSDCESLYETIVR